MRMLNSEMNYIKGISIRVSSLDVSRRLQREYQIMNYSLGENPKSEARRSCAQRPFLFLNKFCMEDKLEYVGEVLILEDKTRECGACTTNTKVVKVILLAELDATTTFTLSA